LKIPNASASARRTMRAETMATHPAPNSDIVDFALADSKLQQYGAATLEDSHEQNMVR
jgi:hypothetical protein